MVRKISIVALLILYMFPHQLAFAGHKGIEALEEKFRASKQTLCQKDLDDIITVQQHLAVMVEIDQEARKQFLNDRENPILIKVLKEIDSFNTAHLKSILNIHPWIIISKFGKEADRQAWLLVQHADHDLTFQEQCLVILETLLPLNETNPNNYAYLVDRVAINSGKKQQYGTQASIDNGQVELLPYEGSLEEMNERRCVVGLEPVEKYLETLKTVYIQTKS